MNEIRTVLDTLDRLTADLEQLQNRRQKIEERRDQVSSATYLKLTAEYDGRIRETEQKLETAAAELHRHLETMKTELDHLTADAQQADQAIEELELRHYIGEYDSEDDFNTRQAGEQAKREELGERLGDLRSQVSRAEAILDSCSLAGSDQPLPVVTDTQPLPAASMDDSSGTRPATTPSPDETLDIRNADELSSTIAAPGNSNPLPMFGDDSDPETGSSTAQSGGSGSEAPPAAVTLNYLDQTREVAIEGYPFTIGRSTKNTLSLKSEEISRYHAQIRYEKGKFVLEDLGSANGTKLDGKRIQRAELKPGGAIGLGPAELIFTLSSG